MGDISLELALIPAIGIACLWLASLARIPAILVLLPAGVIAGPVTGLLDPQELLGDTLFPGVTIAVAILLFEGGLGLRVDHLKGSGRVVLRLVSLGTLISFAIGALGAIWLFDAPVGTAVVLGAVLVVSGPTVVGPILDLVRPNQRVGNVLRWEGITIDPIGATLALVVVEVVTTEAGGLRGVLDVGMTAASGIAVGIACGVALTAAIRRHLVPDHIQAVVAFGVLLAGFLVAEELLPEGGLFAATAMGVTLANQRRVTVAHIANFNETLGQLLLAVLFVVLGANVELGALGDVALPAIGLSILLVALARPLGVAASTAGSTLERNERAFMAWMAPRGIVAAAVSSMFTVQLSDAGIDPTVLAPAAFVVIVATVALYGLTARPAAKALGVSKPPPRGLALIGAPDWALELTRELRARDVPVLVVTTNADEAHLAREAGAEVYDAELAIEDLAEAVEVVGVRQALAAGGSSELRALGVERLGLLVGRANVFVVPSPGQRQVRARPGRSETVRARHAFADDIDSDVIGDRASAGWRVVTLEAGSDPHERDRGEVVPLLHVRPDGLVEIVTQRSSDSAFAGDVVAFVAP